MKIKVLTDNDNNVIATSRFPTSNAEGPMVNLVTTEPGHKIQEIDLPGDLENVNAEDLHKQLKTYIK